MWTAANRHSGYRRRVVNDHDLAVLIAFPATSCTPVLPPLTVAV
jgi:hypothetical protein